MFRRPWRAILIASVGAWAALSPALAPSGGGSASAQDACVSPDANLDLNVAAGSESVKPGDVVTVTLEVSNLTSAINGAQALISYDASVLSIDLLTDITTNAGSGWEEFFSEEDVAGDITYIASYTFGGSTSADATIATLTFDVIAEGTTNITFWDASPLVTKLTRLNSTTLLPCRGVSGDITSACDDGLFCSGIETFDGSVCQPGTPIDCSSFTDDCNAGVCNETTDACEAQPVADGTVCTGNGTGACTASDSCLAGVCNDNDEPAGFACGDPTDDDCTNPDTCDGAGACQANDELVGFSCGDPTDDDCTNPDTCDGAGTCQANDELVGFACGDPTDDDCTNPDT